MNLVLGARCRERALADLRVPRAARPGAANAARSAPAACWRRPSRSPAQLRGSAGETVGAGGRCSELAVERFGAGGGGRSPLRPGRRLPHRARGRSRWASLALDPLRSWRPVAFAATAAPAFDDLPQGAPTALAGQVAAAVALAITAVASPALATGRVLPDDQAAPDRERVGDRRSRARPGPGRRSRRRRDSGPRASCRRSETCLLVLTAVRHWRRSRRARQRTVAAAASARSSTLAAVPWKARPPGPRPERSAQDLAAARPASLRQCGRSPRGPGLPTARRWCVAAFWPFWRNGREPVGRGRRGAATRRSFSPARWLWGSARSRRSSPGYVLLGPLRWGSGPASAKTARSLAAAYAPRRARSRWRWPTARCRLRAAFRGGGERCGRAVGSRRAARRLLARPALRRARLVRPAGWCRG